MLRLLLTMLVACLILCLAFPAHAIEGSETSFSLTDDGLQDTLQKAEEVFSSKGGERRLLSQAYSLRLQINSGGRQLREKRSHRNTAADAAKPKRHFSELAWGRKSPGGDKVAGASKKRGKDDRVAVRRWRMKIGGGGNGDSQGSMESTVGKRARASLRVGELVVSSGTENWRRKGRAALGLSHAEEHERDNLGDFEVKEGEEDDGGDEEGVTDETMDADDDEDDDDADDEEDEGNDDSDEDEDEDEEVEGEEEEEEEADSVSERMGTGVGQNLGIEDVMVMEEDREDDEDEEEAAARVRVLQRQARRLGRNVLTFDGPGDLNGNFLKVSDIPFAGNPEGVDEIEESDTVVDVGGDDGALGLTVGREDSDSTPKEGELTKDEEFLSGEAGSGNEEEEGVGSEEEEGLRKLGKVAMASGLVDEAETTEENGYGSSEDMEGKWKVTGPAEGSEDFLKSDLFEVPWNAAVGKQLAVVLGENESAENIMDGSQGAHMQVEMRDRNGVKDVRINKWAQMGDGSGKVKGYVRTKMWRLQFKGLWGSEQMARLLAKAWVKFANSKAKTTAELPGPNARRKWVLKKVVVKHELKLGNGGSGGLGFGRRWQLGRWCVGDCTGTDGEAEGRTGDHFAKKEDTEARPAFLAESNEPDQGLFPGNDDGRGKTSLGGALGCILRLTMRFSNDWDHNAGGEEEAQREGKASEKEMMAVFCRNIGGGKGCLSMGVSWSLVLFPLLVVIILTVIFLFPCYLGMRLNHLLQERDTDMYEAILESDAEAKEWEKEKEIILVKKSSHVCLDIPLLHDDACSSPPPKSCVSQ